jgi:6-phosphogluconolactonase (cycloisomerase 2 family)
MPTRFSSAYNRPTEIRSSGKTSKGENKIMKRGLQLMFLAAVFVLMGSAAKAQVNPPLSSRVQYVYVSDDIAGSNLVEGFSVNIDTGVATAIAGSPWSTGGAGLGGGYYITPRTVLAHYNNHLYVINGGSSTIGIFTINLVTGALTLESSTTSTGGSCATYGCGMAISPNGRFAYVVNGNSHSVAAFTVDAFTGALAAVPGGSYRGSYILDGAAVTPDGKYVLVSEPQEGPEGNQSDQGAIYVYSINQTTGALTVAAGSPLKAQSYVTGITVNCASTNVYFGDAISTGTEVEGYSIGADGALTALPGSPWISGDATASNGTILTRGGNFLLVTNQDSASLQSYAVAPDGSISEASGMPFVFGGQDTEFPAGMSISRTGSLLFVGEYTFGTPSINIARINNLNGQIALTVGSPVALSGFGAEPLSVDAVPGLVCPAR